MHGVNHGAQCALPLTLTRELSIMRYASASERTVNSFADSKLRYASALVLSAGSRYFCPSLRIYLLLNTNQLTESA